MSAWPGKAAARRLHPASCSDSLSGLKENIIIGKLIPAGTGLKRYKNIEAVKNVPNEQIAGQLSGAEAPQEELA